MPLFDFYCAECNTTFEFLIVRSEEIPICPKCKSPNVRKAFTSNFQIRMDADSILKSMPDPQPPLEELRGKGSLGYADKPEVSRNLKDYVREKDKYGNTLWRERRRIYFT